VNMSPMREVGHLPGQKERQDVAIATLDLLRLDASLRLAVRGKD